jgi:hypothetical protein
MVFRNASCSKVAIAKAFSMLKNITWLQLSTPYKAVIRMNHQCSKKTFSHQVKQLRFHLDRQCFIEIRKESLSQAISFHFVRKIAKSRSSIQLSQCNFYRMDTTTTQGSFYHPTLFGTFFPCLVKSQNPSKIMPQSITVLELKLALGQKNRWTDRKVKP